MPARTRETAVELEAIDVAALARTGLTEAQVAERRELGLANQQPDTTSRSVWAIVRTHLFTLFNLVLGLCAVVIVLLGRWLDLLFSLAALSNIVIGFVQEFSAKRQLDRIALLRRDPARVLRDGSVTAVRLEEIVLDDVLVLSRGDQVPADARVLTADGLDLDESLLTGENDPVVKHPGDRVLSASSVTGGSGLVRVTAVGERSHASRLAQEARQFSPISSELRAALEKVVRWISIALIPIILVVLNGQMQAVGGWRAAMESGAWEDALVVAVSSVASMVPQGLALMTTISFALAAVKLARDEVLIQEQPAVEVLARVDTVCFDKTGTLTEGGVAFDRTYPLEPGARQRPVEGAAAAALAWFGADPHANPTAAALSAGFTRTPDEEPVRVLPFSSANRFSGVEFPGTGAWLLGAPEALLPAGSQALGRAGELAAAGHRTMVLAHARHLVEGEDGRAAQRLPAEHEPRLLIAFSEQVRADAEETLAFFTEQGIELKVFSGDNPATVAAAARRAGMQARAGAVDASALPEEGPELVEAALEHNVFGRVSPHQKKNMVLGLREAGRVVAMTGDGINDALALKHADLGIAMGNAAPATKAVSRLVLLDGRFSRLPSVMAEGRKIIANIERVTHLFLTKTSFAVLMGVTLGLLAWTFPFLPRQYSTADLLIIGGPSFILTMLPNSRRYVSGFLRRALHFALPNAVVVTLGVVGINLYAHVFDPTTATTQQIQTTSFIVLVLLGLWILCVGSRPLTRARLGLLLAMYVLLVLVLSVPWSLLYHEFQAPQADLLWTALAVSAAGCALIELNFRLHQRWLRSHQREAYEAASRAGQG
jgi:cation-transporting ATPase E